MSTSLKVGVAIVALIVVGRAASGSQPQASTNDASVTGATPVAAPAPAKRAMPDMQVDNRKLWNDYEANEVAADATYKGKTLKVTGKVASVDKDFMDDIVLRLASPNEFMTTMATMEKSETAKSAALSKGQPVALICTGKGRVVGSPTLGDCRFADP